MKPTELCDGSGAFPENYDGEFTRCGKCGRRLNLTPGGVVPRHNVVAPKNFANSSEKMKVVGNG